jgi:hypothetical protein
VSLPVRRDDEHVTREFSIVIRASVVMAYFPVVFAEEALKPDAPVTSPRDALNECAFTDGTARRKARRR